MKKSIMLLSQHHSDMSEFFGTLCNQGIVHYKILPSKIIFITRARAHTHKTTR